MVKKKITKKREREDFQKSFIHTRPEPKHSPPKGRTNSAINSKKNVN